MRHPLGRTGTISGVSRWQWANTGRWGAILLMSLVLTFMPLSRAAHANGQEELAARKTQSSVPYRIFPKLANHTPENTYLFVLNVKLTETQAGEEACLDAICFPYDYDSGKSLTRLPVKLTLAPSGPDRVPHESGPAAQGELTVTLPESGTSAILRIQETDAQTLDQFIGQLEQDKKDRIQKSFPKQRHWLILTVKHPTKENRCVQVEIIHTGFIPLL